MEHLRNSSARSAQVRQAQPSSIEERERLRLRIGIAAIAVALCAFTAGLLSSLGSMPLAVIVGVLGAISLGVFARSVHRRAALPGPLSNANRPRADAPGDGGHRNHTIIGRIDADYPHAIDGQPYPSDQREAEADHDIAEAERAVSQGGGTHTQRRRVRLMTGDRSQEHRRQTWLMGEDNTGKDTPPHHHR